MTGTHPHGRSLPLGATPYPDGVNFSLFSKGCVGVELLLFGHGDDASPSRTISLNPEMHLSGHYWHIFVPDIGVGQIYGYRVEGSFAPELGLRFDPSKVLLDPYGRAIANTANYSRIAASKQGDNCATAMKSIVTDAGRYDWDGDEPLRRPFSRTVIYEMHVGGFTKHSDSGVGPGKRGKYSGLIEKIPYLQDLGVTAVELLPVFQFDEQDVRHGLTNYWGYSPVSFFTPHAGSPNSRLILPGECTFDRRSGANRRRLNLNYEVADSCSPSIYWAPASRRESNIYAIGLLRCCDSDLRRGVACNAPLEFGHFGVA